MTRKDFEQIARIVRSLPIGPRERRKTAAHFADELVKTNQLFDMQRFIRASLEGKE